MTRGEALLAMEGGARVESRFINRVLQFWLEGRAIRSTYEGGLERQDVFMGCDDFELVPEPDTAEKFVRDMAKLFEGNTYLLFKELNIKTDAGSDMAWTKRLRALIQQMDGEK